jgi:hypothetical protein
MRLKGGASIDGNQVNVAERIDLLYPLALIIYMVLLPTRGAVRVPQP